MEDSTIALSPFISPFFSFFFFGNVRANQCGPGLFSVAPRYQIFLPHFPPACLPATEVLVLVDFEATMPDELTVAAGDVVKGVSKAGEEGWLQGELGGKKGIFPANFVKVCPRRRAWQ